MRIEIDPSELVEDLLETVRRACCPAKAIAQDLIEVGSPAPFLTGDQLAEKSGSTSRSGACATETLEPGWFATLLPSTGRLGDLASLGLTRLFSWG